MRYATDVPLYRSPAG